MAILLEIRMWFSKGTVKEYTIRKFKKKIIIFLFYFVLNIILNIHCVIIAEYVE